MKLLVLGGTLFLGRHTVEAARARGHQVTLFNRGRTNPELFADVEQIHGDRETDLGLLASRRWDAVFDPSGYLPRVVPASCDALRDAADYYLFISSINVYAERTKPGLVETDALEELPSGTPEELSGETYGPLKVLCEREVAAAFGARCAVIRPGLIYGPHDATDRSAYWPMRIAAGGDVLAPGRPERPTQLIDVRDLAEWLVRLLESRMAGAFSATGPAETLTMGAYLEACRQVTGSHARLVWMDEKFLLDREVGPYSELPLWVPEQFQAFESVDCSKARGAGLKYRPLEETLAATIDWARSLPADRPPLRLGRVAMPPALSRDREAELLAAWTEAKGANC
jgi:2'-hydroxyisoflavone reductase